MAEPTPRPSSATLEPLGAQRYALKLQIAEALKNKLERLAEVLGLANSPANLEALLEKAVDFMLERKDPARKSASPALAKAEAKKPAAAKKPAPAKGCKLARIYIPQTSRRLLLKEAGHRCEYQSPSGKRCDARSQLELDHKHPLALGGGNELANLQVLCSQHNKRKAEREFGLRWQGKSASKNSPRRVGLSKLGLNHCNVNTSREPS